MLLGTWTAERGGYGARFTFQGYNLQAWWARWDELRALAATNLRRGASGIAESGPGLGSPGRVECVVRPVRLQGGRQRQVHFMDVQSIFSLVPFPLSCGGRS